MYWDSTLSLAMCSQANSSLSDSNRSPQRSPKSLIRRENYEKTKASTICSAVSWKQISSFRMKNGIRKNVFEISHSYSHWHWVPSTEFFLFKAKRISNVLYLIKIIHFKSPIYVMNQMCLKNLAAKIYLYAKLLGLQNNINKRDENNNFKNYSIFLCLRDIYCFLWSWVYTHFICLVKRFHSYIFRS